MTTLERRAMKAADADLELFSKAFADNGWPRSVKLIDWQYRQNPTTRMLVELAVAGDTGKLAAMYATIPVRVRLDGRSRLATQSVDTLTDRAFRGRGLFFELATATFERAASEGYAFVFGFPNGSSAPGFFGKLGWVSLDPLPFLICPLRTGYFASRLPIGALSRWVPDIPLRRSDRRELRGIETIERFDDRFTRLWSSFATTIGVAVERDAAYLNWRLVDKPGEHYVRLAIIRDGQPLAFIAFTVKDKHGGRVGYIMELLFAPGCQREARALLRTALAQLSAARTDAVLCWCLPASPSFATYLRAGFVPLPQSLRPVELHFGARAFDPAARDLLAHRRSWYISYLDSDTV